MQVLDVKGRTHQGADHEDAAIVVVLERPVRENREHKHYRGVNDGPQDSFDDFREVDVETCQVRTWIHGPECHTSTACTNKHLSARSGRAAAFRELYVW